MRFEYELEIEKSHESFFYQKKLVEKNWKNKKLKIFENYL